MAQTPLESEGVRARPPRWGRFSGCGMRPEPRPHGALPLEQDSGPPKQRAEFYVAGLIRADPVTVESPGDASLELNQRPGPASISVAFNIATSLRFSLPPPTTPNTQPSPS